MSLEATYIMMFLLFFTLIFSIVYMLSTKGIKKEKNLGLLKIYTPEDEEVEEISTTSGLYKLYEEYSNTKFVQANLRITFKEFKTYVYGAILAVILIFILVSVMFSFIFAIMLSAFIGVLLWKLPDFIVENKKHKRKLALNSQKTDILSIMSSCSSSQMPLDKTFKTLSERLKAPASEIFDEAYSLMKVGNPPEDVLRHLKKIFDSNDFNFLLSAYEVWLENQGSLQDTYRIVSISVRDKEEIDLHMHGLISKTKVNIIVLVCIALLFIILSLVTIADIFVPFAKSLLGQISIIASLFILFYGIHKVNSLKNSIKY